VESLVLNVSPIDFVLECASLLEKRSSKTASPSIKLLFESLRRNIAEKKIEVERDFFFYRFVANIHEFFRSC